MKINNLALLKNREILQWLGRHQEALAVSMIGGPK
jgi:hypothetical protein